ncbi:MAG: MbnH family di-heme enzyme [Woeseiaceae bacterium]
MICCVVLLAAACTSLGRQDAVLPHSDFEWHTPPGIAPPPVPAENPVTDAKVRLGRRLFYDTRLSVNGRGSCASCHRQELAFTDGRPTAIGVTGERHRRSSMSLVNVAYNRKYTWASRKVQTLEQQIAIPLFSDQPVELGLSGEEQTLIAALQADPTYATLFDSAFPGSANAVSIDHVIKALASFVRMIIAADSAFDRLLYLDDQAAMSASALRGMRLFFSDDTKCSACHEGQNLAGGQAVPRRSPKATEFHNTGLYNVGGQNRYPDTDSGLRMESGLPEDDGRFRAPSLRNIALSAPYMHDGSIATLSDVIDHYAAGGRTISDGPNAGIGKANSNKSPLLMGFELSADEKADLLNFLDSLTDYSVLDDPRFSAPRDDR